MVDLVKIIAHAEDLNHKFPPQSKENIFSIMIASIATNINKKQLFHGQQMGPTLKDVNLLLSQFKSCYTSESET